MNKHLSHLLYKGEKIYLCSDVSFYLGKYRTFTNRKILDGALEENEHYYKFSIDEVTDILKQNDIVLSGRGITHTFITEKGLQVLENIVKEGSFQGERQYQRFSRNKKA